MDSLDKEDEVIDVVEEEELEEETLEEEDEELDEDRGDSFEADEEEVLEDDDEVLEDEEVLKEEDEDLEDEESVEKEKGDIPYSRFSEVVGQRQYERDQNEALRKTNEELLSILKQTNAPKEKEPDAYDYDTAEEAHMDAVLEGDGAKAKAIRAEIRAAERTDFLKEAAAYKDEALKGAAAEAGRLDDETKFTKIISRSAEEYEFLNPDAKGYSQDAVNEINDVFEGFMATGKSKAVSLQRAIEIVAPKFGDSLERGLGESKKTNRRKAAVKKNTSTAKKQPPKMRGKTTRNKTIEEVDVNKMSDKAFKKLSKMELAELRGDKV